MVVKTNTSTPQLQDTGILEIREDECTICLGELGNIKGKLVCKHIFCFDCIHRWAKTENTCPLCKKRFKYIEKVVVSDNANISAEEPKKKRRKTNEKVKVAKKSQVDSSFSEMLFGAQVFGLGPPPPELVQALLMNDNRIMGMIGGVIPTAIFSMPRTMAQNEPEIIEMDGENGNLIDLSNEPDSNSVWNSDLINMVDDEDEDEDTCFCECCAFSNFNSESNSVEPIGFLSSLVMDAMMRRSVRNGQDQVGTRRNRKRKASEPDTAKTSSASESRSAPTSIPLCEPTASSSTTSRWQRRKKSPRTASAANLSSRESKTLSSAPRVPSLAPVPLPAPRAPSSSPNATRNSGRVKRSYVRRSRGVDLTAVQSSSSAEAPTTVSLLSGTNNDSLTSINKK